MNQFKKFTSNTLKNENRNFLLGWFDPVWAGLNTSPLLCLLSLAKGFALYQLSSTGSMAWGRDEGFHTESLRSFTRKAITNPNDTEATRSCKQGGLPISHVTFNICGMFALKVYSNLLAIFSKWLHIKLTYAHIGYSGSVAWKSI